MTYENNHLQPVPSTV